jgi:hypothetical protein
MDRARFLALALLAVSVGTAQAGDPCATAFSWDVGAERALFAGVATTLVAGTASASAPPVRDGQAYDIKLAGQPDVAFALPPARKGSDGAHAGLVITHVEKAARYRISLDAPAWIDVVVAGTPIPAADFQGGHRCSAPHKIVEFDLPVGEIMIQLSAAAADTLRFSLTRSPHAGT